MTASLGILVIRSSLVDWRSMKKECRHARHNTEAAKESLQGHSVRIRKKLVINFINANQYFLYKILSTWGVTIFLIAEHFFIILVNNFIKASQNFVYNLVKDEVSQFFFIAEHLQKVFIYKFIIMWADDYPLLLNEYVILCYTNLIDINVPIVMNS